MTKGIKMVALAVEEPSRPHSQARCLMCGKYNLEWACKVDLADDTQGSGQKYLGYDWVCPRGTLKCVDYTEVVDFMDAVKES